MLLLFSRASVFFCLPSQRRVTVAGASRWSLRTATGPAQNN